MLAGSADTQRDIDILVRKMDGAVLQRQLDGNLPIPILELGDV